MGMIMKNGVPYAHGSEIPQGGTKGQVLAKASNISGDFEWVNGGGGGGGKFTQDVLWETPTPDTWVNPVLSRSAREYDVILFEGRQQDGKWCQSFLNVADLGIGEEKELLINGYSWITIKFTDDTHIVGVNGTSTATVNAQKVTGIRFGSSLDGTIGRWEKIGEWTGTTDNIALDLSPYQVLALTSYGGQNNIEKRNTAIIRMEDFTINTELESHIIADVYVYFKNLGNGLYKFGNARTGGGILYGYKEAAISDADVQRIAAQVRPVPDGGTTGQALVKLSDNDGDAGWGDVKIDVDDAISETSENPVQNKVVKEYVDAKVATKQNALTTGKGAKIDNNVISFDYVTAGKKAVAYSGPYTKTVNVNLQYKDADYTFTEYIDFGNMGFTSPSDYSLEIIGSIVHNSSSSIIATCLAESEVSRTVWSGTRSSFTVAKENNRIRLYGWFTGPNSGYQQHDFTCSILCKVYCAGVKPTDTTNIIMQTAGTGGICPQTLGVKGSVAEIPMNSTTPVTVDISALNIDTDYTRETFVQFDYYSYYNGLRQTVVCEGTAGIFNLPIINSAAGDVIVLEARVNGVEGGKLTDIVFTPFGASQGCYIYRVVWGKYTGGSGGSETLDDVLTNGNEATDKTVILKNSTDNGTMELDSFSVTQRYDGGAGLGNFASLSGGTLQMSETNADNDNTAYIGPKHMSLSSTDSNGDPLNHFSMEWSDVAAVSMSADLKAAWKTALDVGGGGTGGGNANFDIGTVPLGGAGVYEVNAILNNGDNESVRAVYSRGANGELPEWFSMNVNSTLGSDNFQVATRELVNRKQDALVSGTNIKTVNGESLLGAGNLNVGVNIEVNKEKWYGTYTDENGVTYQVYSKMIYIPALPSTAGITAYDHGISGIKQILQVYGFTADGFVLNAPRQNAQDNIAIYQMSKSASNKTLSIEVGKDRSSKSAYVVMVYAKNN